MQPAQQQHRLASPPRVLVVDDEPTFRIYAEAALRMAGYQPAQAADGAEAITIFEHEGPFDLLVTDLMMPRMKGDELARVLRQAHPSLRVLYLTGFADRLFEFRPSLWENEGLLTKPCTPSGIVEAVERVLANTGWAAAED